MRLSLFRVFFARVIVTWWRWLCIWKSRCFRSHCVQLLISCSDDPTWDVAYLLFVFRAVYTSVSTIFSRFHLWPPLCREMGHTSTSTRFVFSLRDIPPSILQRLRGGPCNSPSRQRRRLKGEKQRMPGFQGQHSDPQPAWLHDDWNVSSCSVSATA